MSIHHAAELAAYWHGQNKDKDGYPELLHPLRVGEAVYLATKDERLASIAYLHDVLEDTHAAPHNLPTEELMGFDVSAGVITLTRQKHAMVRRKLCLADGPDETYTDYIERIVAAGPDLCLIKLLDMRDNVTRPGDFTPAYERMREAAVRLASSNRPDVLDLAADVAEEIDFRLA